MHPGIIYLQVEWIKKNCSGKKKTNVNLPPSFKVFTYAFLLTYFLICCVIILLKYENNFLIFLSVFLSCIAIGVQMSLEMLEKRFWSIATQVLKLIYHLLPLQLSIAVPVSMFIFVAVYMYMFC